MLANPRPAQERGLAARVQLDLDRGVMAEQPGHGTPGGRCRLIDGLSFEISIEPASKKAARACKEGFRSMFRSNPLRGLPSEPVREGSARCFDRTRCVDRHPSPFVRDPL